MSDKCPKCGAPGYPGYTHLIKKRYECGTVIYLNGGVNEDKSCLRYQLNKLNITLARVKDAWGRPGAGRAAEMKALLSDIPAPLAVVDGWWDSKDVQHGGIPLYIGNDCDDGDIPVTAIIIEKGKQS